MDQAKRVENILTDVMAVPARVFRSEAKIIQNLRRAAIESGDPEVIHDLRVSIRKVRTAIRMFWPVFSQEARLLDTPLRDLFHRLGEIRSLDVAITATCTFSPDVRLEILERLAELRSAEKAKLVAELSNPCVLDYLSALTNPVSLTPPPGVTSGRSHPIQIAHRQARRSYRKVVRFWDGVELHRLRRRVKRLRYTVEFFKAEYGTEAKEYATGLSDLQDGLGKTVDLLALSKLFSKLERLSRPAAKECKRQATSMASEAVTHKDLVRKAKKKLSGRAWKRLYLRSLSTQKPLAL